MTKESAVNSPYKVKQFEIEDGRRRLHWWPRLIIERKSDGATYVASHPGHPMFWGWYLRRVERIAGRLYRETGDVWCVVDDFWKQESAVNKIDALIQLWQYLKGRELRVPMRQAFREYLSLCKNLMKTAATEQR